jgi:copper(I)-binding protein
MRIDTEKSITMRAKGSVKSVKRAFVMCVALVLLASLAACSTTSSGAQIQAEDVWSRPAIAMAEPAATEPSAGSMGGDQGMGMTGTGAVFMRLVNEGREPDRLVGGRTDVAKVVEVHETVLQGDVMKMQMLSDGLDVPARGEVLLKPGGYHLMLIGMQRNLEVGDTFTIDLQFEKSGTIEVEAEVRQP